MKRVLKPTFPTLLVLLILLSASQIASASTFVAMSDDDLIVGARAIVTGKVLSIESAFDGQQERIYSYVTVQVDRVLKGQISESQIVLREMGGQVGSRGFTVFGNPEFTVDERVLLYLDTWKDGSLRVYQLLLGKFSIVTDVKTGQEFAVRQSDDGDVTVIPAQAQKGQAAGPITDRMELAAYIAMVTTRLAANLEASEQFERKYYENVPVLAAPAEYAKLKSGGNVQPLWTFISSQHPRWFEPDSGLPITFMVNPDNAPNAQIMNDIGAAMNCWSTVQGCSVSMVNGGSTGACREQVGLNLILFNSCDGRWSPGPGCSGTLALGGLGWNGNTKIINGTTFHQAQGGFVSFNPYASCNFGISCNVQEITTHELGHTLGLGHSADSTATMYAFAHFDGRCASVRPDDVDGITFIYPGGGGSGPLTVVTSTLAGGTVGNTYTQTLIASGGTPPYTWGLVQGQGTLPPGLTLVGAAITGTPTTSGTYNFAVRVTDFASGTAQKALSIVVTAGGVALSSQFVSQTVPSTLQPGQTFTVNMKFLNTGTQTWSGTAYFFASQNPALNQTWGGNGVPLAGFVAGPGELLSVDFNATAPATPGTYNFQWQMYENGGAGFFGQMSTNVVIQVGSAPQNAAVTIGLYRPNGNLFFLRNSNSVGAPDMIISFGAPGDIPIVGDWDGNGTITIGLYRPSTSTFYLRNSNTQGPPDITISFGDGPNGDIPIVGDWDGNGTWTIGVYRPSTSTFYLRNSNSAGVPDISVTYGAPGDKPLVGDWDGNGTMTIGLFRPNGNWFYLRNTNTTGVPDVIMSYGAPGDLPIVGDWDGDGTTTVGLFRPNGNMFYLRNTNSTGVPDVTVSFGASGDMPVVGNWDGQ